MRKAESYDATGNIEGCNVWYNDTHSLPWVQGEDGARRGTGERRHSPRRQEIDTRPATHENFGKKHAGVGTMRHVEDFVHRFSAVIRLVYTTAPPDTNNWQRGINGSTKA